MVVKTELVVEVAGGDDIPGKSTIDVSSEITCVVEETEVANVVVGGEENPGREITDFAVRLGEGDGVVLSGWGSTVCKTLSVGATRVGGTVDVGRTSESDGDGEDETPGKRGNAEAEGVSVGPAKVRISESDEGGGSKGGEDGTNEGETNGDAKMDVEGIEDSEELGEKDGVGIVFVFSEVKIYVGVRFSAAVVEEV